LMKLLDLANPHWEEAMPNLRGAEREVAPVLAMFLVAAGNPVALSAWKELAVATERPVLSLDTSDAALEPAHTTTTTTGEPEAAGNGADSPTIVPSTACTSRSLTVSPDLDKPHRAPESVKETAQSVEFPEPGM
jgi:hypothetical protein